MRWNEKKGGTASFWSMERAKSKKKSDAGMSSEDEGSLKCPQGVHEKEKVVAKMTSTES